MITTIVLRIYMCERIPRTGIQNKKLIHEKFFANFKSDQYRIVEDKCNSKSPSIVLDFSSVQLWWLLTMAFIAVHHWEFPIAWVCLAVTESCLNKRRMNQIRDMRRSEERRVGKECSS